MKGYVHSIPTEIKIESMHNDYYGTYEQLMKIEYVNNKLYLML